MKRSDSQTDEPMEGSNPALPAEPGTLKVATLLKFRELIYNHIHGRNVGCPAGLGKRFQFKKTKTSPP